jgi:protein-disulfide isomerase
MLDGGMQRTDITPADWSLGSPDAPVTLLEYGDFECPHCAVARPVLESLVAAEPSTVRLVYRHFPVTTIHPHAAMAAEAAEAAGADGRFWQMHDLLFSHQDALEPDDLRAYAKALGLPLQRFESDVSTHRYFGEVKADFRRGLLDGVNGTPTIFIAGFRYDGPRDLASMLAAIAAVREGGRSLGAL